MTRKHHRPTKSKRKAAALLAIIKRSEADIRAGRVYDMDQVARELGIVKPTAGKGRGKK